MDRQKLLLADDSLTIQRVVNLTFAEEGFDVIAVGDGDAALREIANAQPDIVLADVHMPGPSGYEICSLLRGIEETAAIPVILLVGQFEQFDPEEAERAGADAFITKPFQSIRQVVDQVKELVSRSNAVEGPVPAEAAAVEAAAAEPEKDTTDIDSLYEQSFAETIEMSPNMVSEVNEDAFPVDEIDDEMIETSFVSGEPVEPALQAPDFDQTIVSAPTEHASAAEYASPQAADDIADLATEPLQIGNSNAPSYEETLQMDKPPFTVRDSPQGPAHTAHTAPTEELRRDPFATTTDAFDLDDFDLLDLTAAQVDEQFTFGTPTQSVESGSNKQVVTISPELMEIIVRKVVEKLSEKY